jgi:hypothetical protein
LAENLAIEHDQFLLSNTTHAVITAMAGLASDGIALCVNAGRYPPYSSLPSWPYGAGMAKTPLLTHVDPLSGSISMISPGQAAPSVLDAAQSFATIRHHRESLRADVLLCPLHKHAGVSAGVGVLAIRKGSNLVGLRAYAQAAEAGAACRNLLEQAVGRIRLFKGRLVNLMCLEVDEDVRAALKVKGIDVLTPAGAGLPFVSLRGVDPALAASACYSVGLQAKSFRLHNIVRISGAVRGAIDSSPIDCSQMLKRALAIVMKGSS